MTKQEIIIALASAFAGLVYFVAFTVGVIFVSSLI
jgi:hypothetical protein